MFGEATELEKQEWKNKAMMTDFQWFFMIESIRDKVFEVSKVPKLHINEHEAKKLLERLQKEQDKIREQAI